MKDSVRIPNKLAFNRHEKGQEQFGVLYFLHVFQPQQLQGGAGEAARGPCTTSEIHMQNHRWPCYTDSARPKTVGGGVSEAIFLMML